MKLMVYSHDAFGLGNIRRMVAICQHLLKTVADISILVVSGSPALHSLRLPVGLDYIKLPCVRRNQLGQLTTAVDTNVEEVIKLRSSLLLAAVTHFQPDVVLVDKKPDGLQGELRDALTYLKIHRPHVQLVLLLRDILDRPEATIHQWQHHRYYDLVDVFYSQIWVVGSPSVFDLCTEYQFPARVAQKVRFCGYIQRELGLKSAAAVRQELAMVADQSLVVVTLGGGGDGYRLADTYLRGLETQSTRPWLRSLIVLGSEMPEKQQWELQQRAAERSDVNVIEFTDDLMSYLNAATVVVSMGGYNTIGEILTLGKRAVIVPRIEPVAEQWIRADRMEKLGWLRMLHPQQLTPLSLMEAVQQELDSAAVPQAIALPPDMNALPRIADHLAELLHSQSIDPTYFPTHSPLEVAIR